MDIFKKTTEMDKEIISEVIKQGEVAIDATCGNGYDTLFLARQVGNAGKVFAFDIQEKAIEVTLDRLEHNGVSDRVKLINQDHSKMVDYVDSGVRAIMFNCGYLPGSDKDIVTRPSTTIAALDQGLKLLRKDGVLTCVIYPGHETGLQEARKIEEYCQGLGHFEYNSVKVVSTNRKNLPPYLIAIKKLKF